MGNNKKGPATTHSESIELLYALNAVATTLQKSIESEQNVYTVFRHQVVNLGLRGGISLLSENGQTLNFQTVAFTNPLRKVLSRFENSLKMQAEGYSVQVKKVDVYDCVINRGQAVFVPDTSNVSAQVVPNKFQQVIQPLLAFLGSPPGIFAPLIFEGKIMGMLNIVGPNLTERDVPTMQAFANQIAVALENSRLVDKLQSANDELETAYRATLEGWVQALDLRDNETEGHTLRTADFTVTLAEFMGVPENQREHVRRGALLHDIGKMALPDSILRKQGPLDDGEWEIMKQHPGTAYKWLSKIKYLEPALDIPYCHHERWDGSGYPRGLRQEEIPFHARIFSVVDVWDAMLSDRPYRKALPAETVIRYIKDQSGGYFDPQVVTAFMEILPRQKVSL